MQNMAQMSEGDIVWKDGIATHLTAGRFMTRYAYLRDHPCSSKLYSSVFVVEPLPNSHFCSDGDSGSLVWKLNNEIDDQQHTHTTGTVSAIGILHTLIPATNFAFVTSMKDIVESFTLTFLP